MARLAQRLKDVSPPKRIIVYGDWHPPFDQLEQATRGHPLCVYAAPMANTCKEVAEGLVVRTVPRDSLAIALGPWIFSRDALSTALSLVAGREAQIDSLLALLETARMQVRVLRRP